MVWWPSLAGWLLPPCFRVSPHPFGAKSWQLWQAHPYLGPHSAGVLILDETGDPKRGHRIELAARQYLGKLGHVANGVVAVTSQWTDGSRHVPVGVKPYRPASRLPKGKATPAFHTKPDLAWTLIRGGPCRQDSFPAGSRR